MTANLAFDAHPLLHAGDKKLQLPTLMFGPSCGGPLSRMFTGLLSELASHGYVIITVDHPYEQPYLEYPNGTVFMGVLDFSWRGETFLQEIYNYRLTDNSALLDAMPRIASDTGIPINLTHFVFFGHSVGGTTALSAVLVENNRMESEEKTLLGAINMDGDVAGPARANDSSANLHAPSLYLKRTNREPFLGSTISLFELRQSSWIKELRVLGMANHTDFTDLTFLKQALGISGGTGVISGPRMLNVSRTFVKAFMDMVSEGSRGNEGVLSGDNSILEQFPEISFD
jgi:hypothetical protein